MRQLCSYIQASEDKWGNANKAGRAATLSQAPPGNSK